MDIFAGPPTLLPVIESNSTCSAVCQTASHVKYSLNSFIQLIIGYQFGVNTLQETSLALGSNTYSACAVCRVATSVGISQLHLLFAHHRRLENAWNAYKYTSSLFSANLLDNIHWKALLVMEHSNSLAEGDALGSVDARKSLATNTQALPVNKSNAENSGTNKKTPRTPVRKASFNDSAYVSLTTSNNGTGSSGTPAAEEKHSPRRGSVLPGTEFTIFEKETDKDTLERFKEVNRETQTLLAKKITNWNRGNSNPSETAFRLLALGKSESEASYYLVVFCSPKLCGRVRTFLRSKDVKDIYHKEGLKILVVEVPPRRTSAVLDIDVCLDNTRTTNQITFCGSPVLLINNLHGLSHVQTRKATFSGVIEVNFEDGKSIQYGMTAGHAVEDLLSACSADSYGVNNTAVSDYEQALQKQDPIATQEIAGARLESDWLWEDSSDRALFGNILDNKKLPGVLAETVHPSHDWALFEMNSPKPNLVCDSEISGQVEKRSLMIASRPSFNDKLCDPVLMMAASGLKRGRLSSLPGAIMSGSSKSFVETYILELDEGHGTSAK